MPRVAIGKDVGSYVERIIASGSITYDQHDLLIDLMFLDGNLPPDDSECITEIFEMIDRGKLDILEDRSDLGNIVH